MTCRKCKRPMKRITTLFTRTKNGEGHTTHYTWKCQCGNIARTKVVE